MKFEKGCTSCPYAGHFELKECPDAYTDVSKFCGLYDHTIIEREDNTMGRPKKNTERTHRELHEILTASSFDTITKSCDADEMHMNLVISINGFLQHIDKCLSQLTDLEHEREARYNSVTKKGGKANVESASRADDAREV